MKPFSSRWLPDLGKTSQERADKTDRTEARRPFVSSVSTVVPASVPANDDAPTSGIGSTITPAQERCRYAMLCAAQERLNAAYVPGTLVCLDTAEVEAEDRALETAYFTADDEGFTRALNDWERLRRIRVTQGARQSEVTNRSIP